MVKTIIHRLSEHLITFPFLLFILKMQHEIHQIICFKIFRLWFFFHAFSSASSDKTKTHSHISTVPFRLFSSLHQKQRFSLHMRISEYLWPRGNIFNDFASQEFYDTFFSRCGFFGVAFRMLIAYNFS